LVATVPGIVIYWKTLILHCSVNPTVFDNAKHVVYPVPRFTWYRTRHGIYCESI